MLVDYWTIDFLNVGAVFLFTKDTKDGTHPLPLLSSRTLAFIFFTEQDLASEPFLKQCYRVLLLIRVDLCLLFCVACVVVFNIFVRPDFLSLMNL